MELLITGKLYGRDAFRCAFPRFERVEHSACEYQLVLDDFFITKNALFPFQAQTSEEIVHPLIEYIKEKVLS